jgi:lysophospholipase L1-like esterase
MPVPIAKKMILFLGASITQGRISVNYVEKLKEKLGTAQFRFLNLGVAGYESYNVLKKLDRAIQAQPDFVVLLVGTNDVLSALDPRLGSRTRKLKHIPHAPDLQHYSNNITAIVTGLNRNTNAKIALVSLPVLGERLDSVENDTLSMYNAELKKIAQTGNAAYLPVFEKQKEYLLKANEGEGIDCANSTRLAFKSLFSHFLLFRSLDDISRRNGFLLLTDGIHMNSLGAKFITDEIEGFILGE